MEPRVLTDGDRTSDANAETLTSGLPSNVRATVEQVWLKLSFWMKFTAVLYLIFGVFQVIIGFFQFGFGTIAGIIQIILFTVLIRLVTQTKRMPNYSDETALIQFNQRLIIYFRLQALQIAGLFLSFVILAVTIIQFLSNWDWLIQLVMWGKKLGKLLIYAEALFGFIKDWFS